jgi:hypothetical protein
MSFYLNRFSGRAHVYANNDVLARAIMTLL